MSEWLEIRPGGVLIRTAWEYDEEAEKGAYVETDVTEVAFRYLFDECHLHPDVILRDVFALLKMHVDIFSLILDSRLPLLIEEMGSPVAQDAKDEEVEWLELYWSLATEEVFEDTRTPGDRLRPTGKKGVNGNLFPGFHGKGYVREDGPRENYSIAFSPANELMGLPLRLSQEFLLFDEHEWMKRYSDNEEEAAAERSKEPSAYQTKFEGCPYSLGNILHGILWEMLWNGTPAERKERKDELMRRVEDVRREFGQEDDDEHE